MEKPNSFKPINISSVLATFINERYIFSAFFWVILGTVSKTSGSSLIFFRQSSPKVSTIKVAVASPHPLTKSLVKNSITASLPLTSTLL